MALPMTPSLSAETLTKRHWCHGSNAGSRKESRQTPGVKGSFPDRQPRVRSVSVGFALRWRVRFREWNRCWPPELRAEISCEHRHQDCPDKKSVSQNADGHHDPNLS